MSHWCFLLCSHALLHCVTCSLLSKWVGHTSPHGLVRSHLFTMDMFTYSHYLHVVLYTLLSFLYPISSSPLLPLLPPLPFHSSPLITSALNISWKEAHLPSQSNHSLCSLQPTCIPSEEGHYLQQNWDQEWPTQDWTRWRGEEVGCNWSDRALIGHNRILCVNSHTHCMSTSPISSLPRGHSLVFIGSGAQCFQECAERLNWTQQIPYT